MGTIYSTIKSNDLIVEYIVLELILALCYIVSPYLIT